MKLLFILATLFFFQSSAFSQSMLEKLKVKTSDQGLKNVYDATYFLQENEIGTTRYQFSTGSYKVFVMGAYAEVLNMSCWVYDEEGSLIGKDESEDGMAIVNLSPESAGKYKIVFKVVHAKNNEPQECFVLICKQ